jgi:hypothetical protein
VPAAATPPGIREASNIAIAVRNAKAIHGVARSLAILASLRATANVYRLPAQSALHRMSLREAG